MNDFIFFAARRERSVESAVVASVKAGGSDPKISRVVLKPRLVVLGVSSLFFFALSNGALTTVGVDGFGLAGAINKNGLIIKNDLYTNKADRDFSL